MLYGLFGGIPFYLEAISLYSFKSLKDALIKGSFAEYSVFKEEFPIELRTFTRSFTPYFSILIAIAMGKTKFSEISNSLGRSSDISRYLDTLIKLDIIERRKSFWTEKKRDNRYYIKDPFYRFWFRYFYPFTSELTLVGPEKFYTSVVEPSLNDFFSLAFEKFCGEYLIDLGRQNVLPDQFIRIDNFVGTFYEPLIKKSLDLELDIVASGAKKKILIVAECKWWTKSISSQEIDSFYEKAKNFQLLTRKKVDLFKKVELWFFSRQKVKNDIQSSFNDIKFISLGEIENFYN